MKISRTELLAKIDATIEAGRVSHGAKAAKDQADYADELAKWREDAAPKLVAGLRGLAERARKGRPVSNRDVNEAIGSDYRATSLTFGSSVPGTHAEYVPNRDLTSLRSFLQAATDDEITTSTLRDAGWRNLANLLR